MNYRLTSKGPALAAAFAVALLSGSVLHVATRGGALAQTAVTPPPAQQAAAPPTCTPRPGMLSVSRVVEIDTAQGARFGLQQLPSNDFLREKEVVLTFDDGPLRRHTRMVLDALAAHCTRATFFMVGQMALTDPDMVREVARAGHTIAIHTWSHKNLRAIGAAKAEQEIELGASAVQRALGSPVAPFFRFPYLADSQAMNSLLGRRNFGTFSIDADSKDYRTHNPAEMFKNIFASLTPRGKGILLFHDIQFSTANGIRAVLDELAKRGYRVVHIVPKDGAETIPRFDAMAEAEMARRHKLAAATPMVTRSVVWPMAPAGVPTEHFKPDPAAAKPANRQTTPSPAAPAAPAAQPRHAVAPAVVPTPTPAATAAPSTQPAAEPNQPLRGSTTEEDWRQRVFQN